jgi:hypothetical protein
MNLQRNCQSDRFRVFVSVPGDTANSDMAVSIASYQAGIFRESHFRGGTTTEHVADNLKENVVMTEIDFRKAVCRINKDGSNKFHPPSTI